MQLLRDENDHTGCTNTRLTLGIQEMLGGPSKPDCQCLLVGRRESAVVIQWVQHYHTSKVSWAPLMTGPGFRRRN